MTDIKLFTFKGRVATEIAGTASALEKSLQRLIEHNLEAVLGIRLLASEHATGPKHGGRIDTLGIDENASPVIVEYKRATNENVINQGLFYLDWLLDHRAEFKLLVLDKFGKSDADSIDWSAPRLLCIAGGFTRYDQHAVEQINRNVELIRYRRFGEDLLMLELVNATIAESGPSTTDESSVPPYSQKTMAQILSNLDDPLMDLYQALRSHIMAIGDDVQEKLLKFYVAFKRMRNFACVEVHPSRHVVTLYLKADPDDVKLEHGFSRDVRKVGHYGTGDLEITIRNPHDLDRAKPLLQASYEVS